MGSSVTSSRESIRSADKQRAALGAELMESIAAGDRAALARLYDATSPLVHGMALRILKRPDAAEEVTLDVYVQVWRQAARFDPKRATVEGWLVLLARSRAIDRLRSESRSLRLTETDESLARFPSPAPGPDASAESADRRRRVEAALSALPAEQRQAIACAFYGGLSHREVADLLGEPLGTIKTRIRIGLTRLRETLHPLADGGPVGRGADA
jgi:RNA polymerase sigma-70 factor (ECF subfamily)